MVKRAIRELHVEHGLYNFMNDIITSQLDHLDARWIHAQATTGGLYWRHRVVKWRL